MSNADFCTRGCHLSLSDKTLRKHRILLCIGLSCWSFFSNGKQNRKGGSVGEFWDLEEKVANPQKILEVGKLSEGRAHQSRLGVVWVCLFVVPKFAWVERFLTIPCLLTNMID